MNLTISDIYNNRLMAWLLFALVITVMTSCAPVKPPEPTRPAPVEEPREFPPPREIEPSVPVEPPSAEIIEEKERPAQALIDSGRYLDAALLLSELADALPTPQKQDYQLRVASLLLLGNYIQQAEQVLQEINVSSLDLPFSIRKNLLLAELDLAKQMPQQALAQLKTLDNVIQTAEPEHKREYYRIQIDIYSTLEDHVEAARARSHIGPLLEDPVEIVENQETLLRDLQELPADELLALAGDTSDTTFSGWLSLAYVAKIAADEQQAQAEVTQWQARYPGHPVEDSIVETIIAQQPEALGRPTQIALILPMSGRFAKAAEAVRNGFLTAYYADAATMHRPTIKLYDEGDDPGQITAIYQQAVNDGADFVVGPLNKQAVTNLARYGDLQGGVLSLNYGEFEQNEKLPDNFFQMSLSPEQEAIHVAEHAWLDGHTQAAAIFPDSPWGQRVFEAFKARWEELGGVVVTQQTYNMKKSDYAVPIKELLNIDQSESRYGKIRRLVNAKLEFEPRRRKDVDFIFMAAFSRQGRLLRPQLKFHRASDIPVYATSHVFSGSRKPEMDRDMNDVRFSDMPWTLLNQSKNSALKVQIKEVWPNTSNRFMRLLALGIDAYQLVPELNRMRRNRFTTIQAATGVLYLDINNRVQRRLLWAQFKDGVPQVLAEF
jgi:outer membrane PBP1 activator LpoA protein